MGVKWRDNLCANTLSRKGSPRRWLRARAALGEWDGVACRGLEGGLQYAHVSRTCKGDFI